MLAATRAGAGANRIVADITRCLQEDIARYGGAVRADVAPRADAGGAADAAAHGLRHAGIALASLPR
jgi:hypothetical protein